MVFVVRCVSLLLTLFILLGVTVVLGMAVATWIWSTVLQATYPYQDIGYVRVKGLVVDDGNPVLSLGIDNRFTWNTIHIVKIDVSTSDFGFVNESVWIVDPGENKTIVVSSWKSWGNTSLLKPGVKVRVIVYTAERGPIWFDVIVKKASS